MKRGWVLGLLALLVLPCSAQQIMYSNLKELVEGRGDTVTILKVEKRSKNQIYLMGGADYRIEAKDNSGLCRYLKSRCYAVRMHTSLYVNCKKMRYKRYRFGGWYAPAMWVKDRIYFCAQPVGQAAASTATPPDATKLGGEVGDAINASGLVFARVYYELNPETGRSEFVGREKMLELLADYPELKEAFEKETSESAEVIGKYLRQLKSEPTCSIESAQALIELTKKARNGHLPSQQEWEILFATDGYKQFFDRPVGKSLKKTFKASYEIVFDRNLKAVKDSILSVPLQTMKNNEDIVRYFCIQNLSRFGDDLDRLDDYLAGSALSGAFVRGNKQALKYLPDSFAMRHPDHSKFYILLFTPEAWSLSGNVFMDLNCVYSQDEESLVNLIGHELHHSYRWGYLREKYKDSGSPVAVALSMMQSEGCADILNKFEGPYSMKDAGLFGEDVLKQMNENYYNTPKLLQKIDSLTVGYSKGTVDADVYGQVAKLPVNGGHPNGFYMATLIKHQLGLQAIADNSVEPVMFVETYNKAARKAGDEYVFTDEFVAYVKQQYKLMEK